VDIVNGPMSHGRLVTAIAGALVALSAVALAGAAAPATGQWRLVLEVPGIVDVAGPLPDGRLVLSTNHGLLLLRPGGVAEPFANGPGGYTAGGGEPYIALGSGSRVWGLRGCSFEQGAVFALDAGSAPGIFRVLPGGQASRFLDLPTGVFPSGIAFDRFGRFGYRLLVTATSDNNTKTTLYAIDCVGHSSVIAQAAVHVEGGIVVAPPSFARFGGELIAADENTGRIYAFGRDGAVQPVADSGLPAGGDIGVEALGFVPSRVAAVYFSDLGAPGSPTQGDNGLLVLRGRDLANASLRSGELLAAAEGGGATIAVSCAASCSVRRVADGLPATHGEGHLTFVGPVPRK
jgi:hypothetical protein